MTPLVLSVTKKHLSPLRVNTVDVRKAFTKTFQKISEINPS